MQLIKVSVNAIRDGEVVLGVILKQRKRGDAWTNEESFTVVLGEPGAERTFVLQDDQRLVIEAKSNQKIVYDPVQNMARQVTVEHTLVALPPDTDGDESPAVSAVDLAQTPKELAALQAQEKRDAAITAARQKLKGQS